MTAPNWRDAIPPSTAVWLALKVENREDFVTAKQAGYSLFQGYFFRRPERLHTRRIPANHATFLRLLQAISKPQLDFAEIEELIKHEPSLCYRLLRYLNSPLLGLASPVQSVRHALSLLGERESVRWIRMATTIVIGQDSPSDLVLSSLVRARFCELLAPKVMAETYNAAMKWGHEMTSAGRTSQATNR